MNFSIIIPTYRRSASLEATLRSILAQENAVFEVIVISQSEDAAHAEVIRMIATLGMGSNHLKLLRLAAPSSTAARNAGIEVATGDWVIFSDDDVIWPARLLAKLTAKISASGDIVMLAAGDTCRPNLRGSLWRRWLSALFCAGTWRPLRSGKVLPSIQGRYPVPLIGDVPTEWAMGYWFAVRRDHMEAHRLRFDERMSRYAYAEDLLFSVQCARAACRNGLRSILSEEISVAHMVSTEWRSPSAFAELCGPWNRIFVASQLYSGFMFWTRLLAIYWSLPHQVAVRLVLRRPCARYIYAHWLALRHLSRIRRGSFDELYRLYGA